MEYGTAGIMWCQEWKTVTVPLLTRGGYDRRPMLGKFRRLWLARASSLQFCTMTWADMEAHEDNMPARFGKDDARGWSGIRVTEFQASGSVAV